jgi:hypothetical protein
LTLLETGAEVRLLNPGLVRSVHFDGREFSPEQLQIDATLAEAPGGEVRVSAAKEGVEVELEVEPWVESATVALLYEPSIRLAEEEHPQIRTWLDGQPVDATIEEQKGRWAWHLIEVDSGSHTVRMHVESHGSVSVWLVATHQPEPKAIRFDTREEVEAVRPMPPRPRPAGTLRSIQKLGEIRLAS